MMMMIVMVTSHHHSSIPITIITPSISHHLPLHPLFSITILNLPPPLYGSAHCYEKNHVLKVLDFSVYSVDPLERRRNGP